jgi:hypothetical protein
MKRKTVERYIKYTDKTIDDIVSACKKSGLEVRESENKRDFLIRFYGQPSISLWKDKDGSMLGSAI